MALNLKKAFASEVGAPEACGRIRAYETLAAWAEEPERNIAAKIAWERWPMEHDDQAKSMLISSLSQLLEAADPRLIRIYRDAAASASQEVRSTASQLFVEGCPPVLRERMAAVLQEVENPLESMVDLASELYAAEEDRPILLELIKRAVVAGCENAWPKLHAMLGKGLTAFLRDLAGTFEPDAPMPIWLRTLTGFALRKSVVLGRREHLRPAGAEWFFPEAYRPALLEVVRTLWARTSRCKYVGGTAELTAELILQRHELQLDATLVANMIRCPQAADAAAEELIKGPEDSILAPLARDIWDLSSPATKVRAAEHWAKELMPPLPDRLAMLRTLSRRCRVRDRDALVGPWQRYLQEANHLVGDIDDVPSPSPHADPTLVLFAHVSLASKLLRFRQIRLLKVGDVRRVLPSLTYVDSEDFIPGQPPAWIVAGAPACSSAQTLPFSLAETVASMGDWRWSEVFAVALPPVAFPGLLGVEPLATKEDLSRLLSQIQSPVVRLTLALRSLATATQI